MDQIKLKKDTSTKWNQSFDFKIFIFSNRKIHLDQETDLNFCNLDSWKELLETVFCFWVQNDFIF